MFPNQACLLIVYTRPCVAGAVQQSPLSLPDSLINKLSGPFVQNIQDTVYPKPKELWS